MEISRPASRMAAPRCWRCKSISRWRASPRSQRKNGPGGSAANLGRRRSKSTYTSCRTSSASIRPWTRRSKRKRIVSRSRSRYPANSRARAVAWPAAACRMTSERSAASFGMGVLRRITGPCPRASTEFSAQRAPYKDRIATWGVVMVQAEHLADVAELAGGFIHEVKNHVSTLNLNVQLLAEDFADPQTPRERRAKQRIDRLQAQNEKHVEVSNDFLRFVRSQELRGLPTRLEDGLTEMVDFFGPTARAANIDIRLYATPGLPPVNLDRELFKQAILNLMLNAEQAMPEGGSIV